MSNLDATFYKNGTDSSLFMMQREIYQGDLQVVQSLTKFFYMLYL